MSNITVIQPENYTSDEPLQLAEIVKSSPLEKSQGQKYLDLFKPFFNKMNDIEKKIGLLNTVAPSKEDINIAREIRLALKNNRVAAEKIKDDNKASIIIEGRLIDSLFGVVNNSSKSLELKCQEIEKAAEIAEAACKAELKGLREGLLQPYEIDLTGFDLGNMAAGTFEQLLENTKAGFEKRLEDKRIEEENKIKSEAMKRLHEERKNMLLPMWQFIDNSYYTFDLSSLSQLEFQALKTGAETNKKIYDDKQAEIASENLRLKVEQDLQTKRYNALKPYLQYCEGLNMTALYVFAEKEFEDILFDKQASYNKDKQESEAAESKRLKDVAGRKASAEQVLISFGFVKSGDEWLNDFTGKRMPNIPEFTSFEHLKDWQKTLETDHYKDVEFVQQRLAALAPDKEKLQKLAEQFDKYELPEMTSDVTVKIMGQVESLLSKISTYIKQQIEKL